MCFVYPVISYACETWALRVTTKKILDVIWMKWMRRCAGVSIADKIRNVDILEDLNQIPLSKRIEERQLKYAGHVFRMEENRSARLVLTASLPEQNQFIHRGRDMSWRRQVLEQLAGKEEQEVKKLFEKKTNQKKKR